MSVEVIIPWRGECPHRERALEWLLRRLAWPVTVAEAPEGPWNKGATVWPAVAASSADIVVVHDADVWCDGLDAAIRAVQDGEPWAMPHKMVYRLSEQATATVLARGAPDLTSLTRPAYEGWWGGGIVAIPRDIYLSVPIDARFNGWGGEDWAWATALWFLWKPGWRGQADLIHLYHPRQKHAERRTGGPESKALVIRYRRARRSPAVMRALVDEGRPADVARNAA